MLEIFVVCEGLFLASGRLLICLDKVPCLMKEELSGICLWLEREPSGLTGKKPSSGLGITITLCVRSLAN